MAKPEDLKPTEFPQSSWEPKEAVLSLDKLFVYVTAKAERAVNWYYVKRDSRRRMGSLLRYGAILSTGTAGVIPLLGTIFKNNNVPWVDPAWAAMALAAAALMIAIDKFGGFTSGWIRYVLAAQQIDEAVENFRFTWELEKHKLQLPISGEASQIMIAHCKDFLLRVQEIVREETQKWATEFQAAIKEVDEAAKAAAAAIKEKTKIEQVAGLGVEVENGLLCESGWQLSLDGGPSRQFTGRRASLANLKPGIYAIQVVGVIGGKQVQDSKPVKVLGGGTSTVSLKLE